MGRKLNVSTPTVINTELIPLTESFYVEADGQLEQWYYENDGRYAPNRKVTPMTLTPHISAFDKDTNTTYTPNLYIVRWYELAWNETQQDYVETEITNSVDSLSADYVKVGNNLLVKKNVGYTHSVTIRCRAQYIDPRDSGITYGVNDEVLMTTNRDATVMTPELDIKCPSSQAFNPLTDNEIVDGNLRYKSEFTMKATSDMSSVLATDISQYKVDPLGTEEVIPTNETAIVTSAPTMDIRYGDYEQTGQTFMRRQVSGGQIPYIAGNMAYVNKIKGNTVKFNQITPNNKKEFTVPSTQEGVYDTFVANLVNGHKYLYIVDQINTFTSAVRNTPSYNYGQGQKVYMTLAENNHLTAGRINWFFRSDVTETCTFGYWCRASEVRSFKNQMLLDLTALGIDNLTTTAEVESWLATNIGLKSYYPYNAGELIPVKMSAIKSVGFNLWDEQWELGNIDLQTGDPTPSINQIRSKNFIPIVGGQNYCASSPNQLNFGIYVVYYDANKNAITPAPVDNYKNNAHQSPSNAYFAKFYCSAGYGTTYNHDICINLSDPSRNGTYEAHWEAEQYLPITELKGKVNGTGESVVIFPNGMNRVGDVYDEIKVEDGVIKAIKRCDRINLGDLTWNKLSNRDVFVAETTFIKNAPNTNTKANIICAKYNTENYEYVWAMRGASIAMSGQTNNNLAVYDPVYVEQTDSVFKAAMDGVYLVYELATPVEYIIDNMPRGQFEWYGISNNQEVLVETLPWYKSGQHTDTLVVDAMYGEEIRVVLRARVSAGANRLYPNKVYRSVVWQIPNVDINTFSGNGNAIRSNTKEMKFDAIINVKGNTLSEQVRTENLMFNWKTRKSGESQETDRGWGQRRTLPASALKNVIGTPSAQLASTIVLPYGYLLGAYEKVTDSNEEITDNGEPVFDRPLF